MKNKNSILLLLVMASFSWAEKQEVTLPCRVTSYCDIPYNKNGVQDGLETCYYGPDKKEKVREITWKNGHREGPARCFEKGKLKVEASYVNDLLHGLYVEKWEKIPDEVRYLVDGQWNGLRFLAKSKSEFDIKECWKNNVFFSSDPDACMGVKYGPYDSALRSQIQKEQDKKFANENGKKTKKYSSGKVEDEFTLVKGRIEGERKYYYESGKLKGSETYKNGHLTGKAQYYNENGKLAQESENADGFPKKVTDYYESGTVEKAAYLKSEKPVLWCYTTHYEDGSKRESYCEVSQGYYPELDGDFTAWNKKGDVLVQGKYISGLPEGHWKVFVPYFSKYDAYYPFWLGDWAPELSYEIDYKNGHMSKEVQYLENKTVTRTYAGDGSLINESVKLKTTGI